MILPDRRVTDEQARRNRRAALIGAGVIVGLLAVVGEVFFGRGGGACLVICLPIGVLLAGFGVVRLLSKPKPPPEPRGFQVIQSPPRQDD